MEDSKKAEDKKEVKKVESEFPLLEGLGEAGGIAFTSLRYNRYDDNGFPEVIEISLTARGRNAAEAFDNLGDGIKYAMSRGWDPYKKGSVSAPRASAQSVPTGTGASPAPAPVTGVVPPSPTTAPVQTDEPIYEDVGGENVIHATKLVVTPRDNGKVSLGFFASGHKFADITKVCTVEQAIQSLKPIGGFTEEHFKAIATYEPIAAEIVWVASDKKNSVGNPYKNIMSITAE